MSRRDNLIVSVLIKHIKANSDLYKSFNFSHKQQKYELYDIINDILYVLKTGISWRNIRSHISWISVYKRYIKLNKYDIFKTSYIDLLNKYCKKGACNKLRFIITDTSFIQNKNGKDVIGNNKYYNRKNGTKISMITDAKGIPLNIECYKGNIYDSKILLKQLKTKNLIEIDNIHNKYFLADAGYDTKEIRNEITDKNYEPIILQNKRNIKDPSKITKFTKQQRKIYKQRLIIERIFSKMKMNRRISLRYDSKIENFKGFIYLSLIKLLC